MASKYIVRRRYMTNGNWHEIETDAPDDFQEAWAYASWIAERLDREYGDSHFWTVDLVNPKGEGYVQLFHGRLS